MVAKEPTKVTFIKNATEPIFIFIVYSVITIDNVSLNRFFDTGKSTD